MFNRQKRWVILRLEPQVNWGFIKKTVFRRSNKDTTFGNNNIQRIFPYIYPRNHTKFLKMIVKYMKKYINFYTFTKETYKISKHYSKLHEKVYKFPR